MNLPDIEQRLEALARNYDLAGGLVSFTVEIKAHLHEPDDEFKPTVTMRLYTHKLGTVADGEKTVESCFAAVADAPKAKLERLQKLKAQAAALEAEIEARPKVPAENGEAVLS